MTEHECLGCGWCCRKGPCSLAAYALIEQDVDVTDLNFAVLWEENKGCPSLEWDGERWRCGLYTNAPDELKEVIKKDLALGEGCCASLNTYSRLRHVPTPEELKDEKALLDRLHRPRE